MTGTPYKMKFQPIVLKQLVLDCDLVQAAIARAVGCSRPTVNLAINRGYIPTEFPRFRSIIEGMIRENECCMEWLKDAGYAVADIWQPLGSRLYKAKAEGHGYRTSIGMNFKALLPGDPEAGECTEVREMLNQKARKQFLTRGDRIHQSPFGNNFDPEKDAFLTEDHRFIKMVMEEAAEDAGMVAVIGEVGSGKTAMRKLFIHSLKQEPNMRIIYPRIVDKRKISDNSICDAIILDLGGEKAVCPNRPEQKARKVEALITKHARDGVKLVLIIEEAQDLAENPRVLKLFKRFNEIESNGRKALGIILIGQPELGQLLDENVHSDMREVIRRIQVAEIHGLNGALKGYLQFKFEAAGLKLASIMDDKAIDALNRRLTTRDGAQSISIAYPLTVNNYVIRAMNWAAAHGEEKVTEEVVNAI